MSTITLVSWEGIKVKIPFEASNQSDFLKHCPDLNEEINLKTLEIDTKSLELINNFLSIQEDIQTPEFPITESSNIFKNCPKTESFFEKLILEELLLLISAAYRLDFKELQRACCYQISYLFASIPKTEIDSDLNIDEMTVDEDDFMKYYWNKKPNK